MKCKLVFADGTVLDRVTVDNGVYSSETEVTDAMLNADALETVRVVFEDETEQELRFAKTDVVYVVDGKWKFVLVPANADEMKIHELRKDNDMLTECILEMSEIIYGE